MTLWAWGETLQVLQHFLVARSGEQLMWKSCKLVWAGGNAPHLLQPGWGCFPSSNWRIPAAGAQEHQRVRSGAWLSFLRDTPSLCLPYKPMVIPDKHLWRQVRKWLCWTACSWTEPRVSPLCLTAAIRIPEC